MAVIGKAKLVSKETVPTYRWRGFFTRWQQRRDDVLYIYSAHCTTATTQLPAPSVTATLEQRVCSEINPVYFECAETWRHKGLWRNATSYGPE